jgi:hypothetical protein
MFPHNPPAVTVTEKDIYFPGKDPSVLYFFDHLYEPYSYEIGNEDSRNYEIPVTEDGCYKFRHPNRIQTSTGTKKQKIISMNFERKKKRNRREYEHRSKERKLLQKVA